MPAAVLSSVARFRRSGIASRIDDLTRPVWTGPAADPSSPGSLVMPAAQRRSDDVEFAGPADRLVAAAGGELAQDGPDMGADRVDGDVHPPGDLVGREQLGEVHQDLVLLLGERLDQDRAHSVGLDRY